MPPGAPRDHDPRITVIQQELFNEKRSKVDKYRELVVGQPGLWPLIKYELVMLVASWVPGALGLFLRSASTGPAHRSAVLTRHPSDAVSSPQSGDRRRSTQSVERAYA